MPMMREVMLAASTASAHPAYNIKDKPSGIVQRTRNTVVYASQKSQKVHSLFQQPNVCH